MIASFGAMIEAPASKSPSKKFFQMRHTIAFRSRSAGKTITGHSSNILLHPNPISPQQLMRDPSPKSCSGNHHTIRQPTEYENEDTQSISAKSISQAIEKSVYSRTVFLIFAASWEEL